MAGIDERTGAGREYEMQLALRHFRKELDEADDEELVRLAREGGEYAVRLLVQRHNRRLFRVARAVVRDDAEAEDVVQETYVRAFTALDRFRGGAQFSTWLTRIALNEALGRLRRRRPTQEIGEVEAAGGLRAEGVIMFPSSMTPPSGDSELARKEIRQFLEQAVDELPEPFRLVFVLRDIEELSVEETAQQLSLKPETVKTRLHRARKQMRATIEKRLSPSFCALFPFDGERCAHMADRVVERLASVSGP